MKAYVGDNAESGSVHRTRYAAADESEAARTHEVLHQQEGDVFLDVVYSGVHKREKILKAQADGVIKTDVQWSGAMKHARLKGIAEGPLKQLTQALEQAKAKICARAEHPFHVVKNLFKHKKAHCVGFANSGVQCDTLFALANLVISKEALLHPWITPSAKRPKARNCRKAAKNENCQLAGGQIFCGMPCSAIR